MPVGASRAVAVDVRFCSATHRDLRERVAEKRFREDLYFRVGRPAVALPPLRDRREEVPMLLEAALQGDGLTAHASLVELCMTLPWPGNVRELLVEVTAAGRAAAARGERRVRAADLPASAGVEFAREDRAGSSPATSDIAATPPPSAPRPPQRSLPARDEIEAALRRNNGRVATTARDLGVHRNQLRRWLTAEKIDVRSFGDGGDDA